MRHQAGATRHPTTYGHDGEKVISHYPPLRCPLFVAALGVDIVGAVVDIAAGVDTVVTAVDIVAAALAELAAVDTGLALFEEPAGRARWRLAIDGGQVAGNPVVRNSMQTWIEVLTRSVGGRWSIGTRTGSPSFRLLR